MMISRFFRGAAYAMALASFAAAAEETTWEVTGTFDVVEDASTNLPSDFAFGTEYRIVIRFDNEVAPWRTRPVVCDAVGCRSPNTDINGIPTETPTGFRYDITQFGMQIDLYAGVSCQPCTFTSPTGGNLIVRDNYPVALGQGQKPTDGISLALFDPDDELNRYHREFCGDPETWYGQYSPSDEYLDKEDVGDWALWYRIVRN